MNQIGQLPEWIDFEMEEQPDIDISPLMGALKQKRAKPPAAEGGIGKAMSGALGGGMDMGKMAGGAKGGMQSL